MDNGLMMDVSGSWVRKPSVSSVKEMNAWADERERLFLAKHFGGLPDPSDNDVATDGDIVMSDAPLSQI
jgi:hypothetical protein